MEREVVPRRARGRVFVPAHMVAWATRLLVLHMSHCSLIVSLFVLPRNIDKALIFLLAWNTGRLGSRGPLGAIIVRLNIKVVVLALLVHLGTMVGAWPLVAL